MHTNKILDRLNRLETVNENAPALLLVPNADGSFTACDQHHKGRLFTSEAVSRYTGPVIILDVESEGTPCV